MSCSYCNLSSGIFVLHDVENQLLNICLDCKKLLSGIAVYTVKTQRAYIKRNFAKIKLRRTAKRCRYCDIPYYDIHSQSEYCPNCLPSKCLDIDLWQSWKKELLRYNIDVAYYTVKSSEGLLIENIEDDYVDGQYAEVNFHLALSRMCLLCQNKKLISHAELEVWYNTKVHQKVTNVSFHKMIDTLLANHFLEQIDDSYINQNNYYLSNKNKEISGSIPEQVATLYLLQLKAGGHLNDFQREWNDKVDPCVYNKRPCRFDFMIETNKGMKFILELHGAQHFTLVDKWVKSVDELKQHQDIDTYKKYWAEQHGFKYIMIPYYAGVVANLTQTLF